MSDDGAAPPRQSYAGETLRRAALCADPIEQLRRWFEQALASDQPEPNAMVLATAAWPPSQRTVLLKRLDADGLVFFTNYRSRKAREIERDPRVSLLFPWYRLRRQVIVAGRATKVGAAESLRYFLTRPRGSQLGAWVSRQSSVIGTRALLEAKRDEIRRRFAAGEVPLPSFWGGYRVTPQRVEFWQGQPDRLHDRFLYRRGSDDGDDNDGDDNNGDDNDGDDNDSDQRWRIERLSP